MEENNRLFPNIWFYNKYINSKNDNKFNIKKAKLEIVPKDSMFTDIINLNNLESIVEYDNNLSNGIPKSLNDYYQKYPTINLNNKTILSTIYDIYNINDLKKWLNNNKHKHIKTINRVLDLAWFEFNNKIYYEIDFITNFYYDIYKIKFKNYDREKIKDIIDKSIKEYNNKLDINISLIINKNFN